MSGLKMYLTTIDELKDLKEIDNTDEFRLPVEGDGVLKENEWRMGPLRYDTHDDVTAWGIFCRHPETGDVGDIYPVISDVPYWESMEIVRAHNFSHGVHKPKGPALDEYDCQMCKRTFLKWQLNPMAVCGSCMKK